MMIGQTISHYKILEKLGEGGMGVVYKAQDTKLDRFVALKFLPPHMAASEQDKARFVQEAKSAAALNHPNVCSIIDIQEHDVPDGTKQMFIVMEFVDGQTLQEKKSSLTVKQAIDYGIQIAEGLAAAHEKGIIHRDIKPENIMIRKDGIVQVMDFGLAKLVGVSRLTKAGSTVGTAGYMSPEQVQGQETDHRSDIFSFGVLLYEMITGRSPFTGAHESAILYEIVNVDVPPPSTIKPEIDPELDRIVLECMEKDPNERSQSIKQIAIDLNRFKRTSSRTRLSRTFQTGTISKTMNVPNSQAGIQSSFSIGKYLPWGIAAVSVVIVIISVLFLKSDEAGVLYPIHFGMKIPKGEMLDLTTYGAIAISPDGKTVVFASNGRLMKRPINKMDAVEMPGTENGGTPFFSPDNRWVGFIADNKLKKALVAGGPPVIIAEGTIGDNRGAAWGPDGFIIYAPTVNTGLWKISDQGGTPKQITFVDTVKGERTHRWPSLLPDGKTALFTVGTLNSPDDYEDATIDAVNIETGVRTQVVKNASTAKCISDGYLIYTNTSILYAVPFDIGSIKISGTPVPVIQGINGDVTSGAMAYDVSRNGTLAYIPGISEQASSTLFKIDMKGTSVPFTMSPGTYLETKVSPDGKKIAMVSVKAKDYDVVVYDIDRQTITKLTFGGINRTPLWSPDGKKIAFFKRVGESLFGNGFIMVRNADGSGANDTVIAVPTRTYLNSWSKDGKYILLDVAGSQGDHLKVLNIGTDRTVWDYLVLSNDTYMGALSPDGKNVAYLSNESGFYQVYVQSFPVKKGKWQISTDPGAEPKWSPDGKKLFYSSRGKMMVVDVLRSDPFDFGPPRVQYDGDRRISIDSGISYDLMKDGNYFVSLSSSNMTLQENVNVIVNWPQELRTKVQSE